MRQPDRLPAAFDAKIGVIREAVAGCGWPLAVAVGVTVHPPVDGRELAAVRTFDPAGNFVR